MAQGTAQNGGVSVGEARHDRLVDEVLDVALPPAVDALADEYDRRVGLRNRFVWQWIYRVFDEFTLSCVPDDAYQQVKVLKTELTMFVTVLDDLADHAGDVATFEQARRIPHAPASVSVDAPGVDGVVVEFARTLWERFEAGVRDAPRWETFADVFAFDVRQVVDGMEYSQVVNDFPAVANLADTRQYGPNNMVMFPYADVDLLFSPGFDTAEFGRLRSLLWDLQRMARIGNWVSTWEREVREGDFSAGVVVRALEQGLRPDDVADAEALVSRIHRAGIEAEFREEWDERFRAVKRRDPDLDTVDTGQLIEGMRRVMDFHLASDGYK